MRLTRTAAAVGLAAAVSLAAAACGSSSSTSSSSASDVNKAQVTVAKLTGQQTAVTLDTATITALKGLGVTVSPYGTAHGVTLADGAAVAFPITGGNVAVYPKGHQPGYVTGTIDHAGSGITLAAGGKSINLTDFVINPGTSMLTGTVAGKAGTPLFFLDGSALQISHPADGTYHLDGTKVELLPAAATVLDQFFGVKDGTIPPMAEIGVAHIVAA